MHSEWNLSLYSPLPPTTPPSPTVFISKRIFPFLHLTTEEVLVSEDEVHNSFASSEVHPPVLVIVPHQGVVGRHFKLFKQKQACVKMDPHKMHICVASQMWPQKMHMYCIHICTHATHM